jgi:DNA-binding response OmpR family regulator
MGFDKTKVRIIINNLYSNALKFTPEDGYIHTSIHLLQLNGQEFVRLDIADSGCGIPEKEQQKVFNQFYQCENNDPGNATGSGLGLYLTREYVELHGGRIMVDSKEGEGSVFSVFIPAGLSVSDPVSEQSAVHESASDSVAPIENPALQPTQKTLLIVEDNMELSWFLTEHLSVRYRVLQAADGKKGLAIARKKIPDLIVSDLMMPVLSGIVMCQYLKEDIQTSHIPIILLTAKMSDEIKIETYRAGVDSFISKPFNVEVLLARIEMLIEQQEKRRQLFHKTIEITPSSITTTSLDEELIRKALLIVEKNMDNTDFSVDELASELAISRRQLSRKFQSIIELSPNQFIRSVRLKRAAQLLKDSTYNVSEISDRSGFSSIKYFNLYFKEEFGVTPTAFRLENAKQK